MTTDLVGKRVAILATNGFEQSELEEPRQALEEAGASTVVISPEEDEIRAWDEDDWGYTVEVDEKLSEANPAEFDALRVKGEQMGFSHVASGPMVRSSYHADRQAHAALGAV